MEKRRIFRAAGKRLNLVKRRLDLRGREEGRKVKEGEGRKEGKEDRKKERKEGKDV